MDGRCVALLGALLALARPASAVEVGDTIDPAELPALKGGKAALVGDAKANVFVFAKPGQEHSRSTLQALARMEKEFSGKPVRFAAVISDRFPKEEIAAFVQPTGFGAPVLLDAGEELYGKLHIRLHPVVGVVDQKHKLVAFMPFTKLDYEPAVKGEIQFVLGEITEEQLQKVRAPPAAVQGGSSNVAQRYLKMGERLLKAQDYARALDSATRSLEQDASLGPAHGLAGAALAGLGRCPEALKEFDAALAADPSDARSAEGRKGCAAR